MGNQYKRQSSATSGMGINPDCLRGMELSTVGDYRRDQDERQNPMGKAIARIPEA